MHAEVPLVDDYLCWLSDEISGLPDMLSGVNENFPTAAIEGALAMAGDSIDHDIVWGATAEGGADVLLVGSNVRRVTQAVSKKWWHQFDYNLCCLLFMLNKKRYLFILMFCFDLEILTLLLLSLRPS
jgi:hypothetical protein